MTDMTSNPLKSDFHQYEFSSDLMYIKQKITSLSRMCLFLIFSNIIMLGLNTHISFRNNVSEEKPVEYKPLQYEEITLYDEPEVNLADSKHVLNLMEFDDMDDYNKDNIFNNLDSIIVSDGDDGSTRHQISKVNWLFDEADTMLIYTMLGEVFALASNGTISEYNTMNNGRRLLQKKEGAWLEGRISDVVHHGTDYSDMIKIGKPYLRTREKKRKLIKVENDIREINEQKVRTDLPPEKVEELNQRKEQLMKEKEDVVKEKEEIPIVHQKPIEEVTLDSFMLEREVERLEKQYEETKLDEVVKFKDEVDKQREEELIAIKEELDTTRIEIEEAKETMDSLIELEDDETKKEQMMRIKESLDDTNGKISFTQLSIQEDKVRELPAVEDKRRHVLPEKPVNEIREQMTDEELRERYEMMSDEELRNRYEMNKEENIESYEESRDHYEMMTNEELRDHYEMMTNEELRDHYEMITNEEIRIPEEERWQSEEIEDISRTCRHVRREEVCVCTNKLTREVTRC